MKMEIYVHACVYAFMRYGYACIHVVFVYAVSIHVYVYVYMGVYARCVRIIRMRICDYVCRHGLYGYDMCTHVMACGYVYVRVHTRAYVYDQLMIPMRRNAGSQTYGLVRICLLPLHERDPQV
jgi:hypothetical protein